MPQETETVTGNPEQQNGEAQKQTSDDASEIGDQILVQVDSGNDSQPSVQEDACVLKPQASIRTSTSPKNPVAEATEDFLLNEKGAYRSDEVASPSKVTPDEPPVPDEPRTPANSEESESATEEQPSGSTAPQVVEVAVYSDELVVVEALPLVDEPDVTLNGTSSSSEICLETEQSTVQSEPEPEAPTQLTNGQSNGECKYEPIRIAEPEPEPILSNNANSRAQVILNGTIANELVIEDYRLPDVVEVKKHFEYVEPAGQNVAYAPPKKGALSTRLNQHSVKQAYQDVRQDGSDTQWAVFKFEGPTIVTSATGDDFARFKTQFGDDERAFGYIRVQTGDEMSKRAKFIFLTWVGPSVSVLKRAKMSTDKALIKDIVSNFAVELQTENIADINLQNFEAELDKAAGAHYGTGVRS